MASLVRRLRESTQAVVGSVTTHRILLYSLFSFIAVSAAITNAVRNYSNFYSVAIYLSKSSRSVLVLANFGFLVALLAAHVVQKIFFGPLRPSEVERLYDRLWFFITESLLAFTIFRDEFDIGFVIMFGFLLFVKSFHWIASDRIEWMDQRPYPGPSLLFHVRMTTLFLALWTTDMLLFMIAVDSTMTHGIGGMVLFASEYGILLATVANTVAKYLLSTYEFRRAGLRGGENAPPWEHKSMWVFYIELATDFLKLSTYMIFFTIIMTYYGIPLNILRDVYVTGRSLITRLRSLHRYQTATRNMDERYPNATEQEMAAMSDHTCIICREEMVLPRPHQEPGPAPEGPNTTPKKLPCGHIFHFNCLRSWLERQQSCPTCRRNVLETRPNPNTAVPPALNPAAPPDPNANNWAPDGLFVPPQHAQPGQVQLPPNVNIAQNPPNGGLFVQYQIQYQVPRPPVQPLQPVPPFAGFAGPAGAWQAWPPAEQPPAPAGADVAEPAPTPTSEGQPIRPASDSPTPREVAALAALRRLHGGPVPVPSTPTAAPAAENSRLPSLIPISVPIRGDSSRQSQLPATLTDEQLAIMDSLTREAIDERLRVLEGVSGAVNRCIDDLMRMRSVFPPVPAPEEEDEAL
ncbi:RING-type domain-containing protein [Mycena chlorophos]|uniref:RING-type E3 ubiquitin transferase n=1 Tax=Mycena chlorophos TaxID=658473 RepID=A0A8H6W091_MYCCL|nr:RING-type domain-containing protein [Mycena chlorophos]